jgi:hydrogenase expression/formation protein HypE
MARPPAARPPAARPPVVSPAGAPLAKLIAADPPAGRPSGPAGDPAAADERAAVSARERRILQIIETARAKPIKFRDEQITMAHGAGGKATQALIEGLFVPAFTAEDDGGGALAELADASGITIAGTGLALSTDSFVVKPIRFPGGSIGELAVNGTVNDLAMAGARPLALALSLILEEGLPARELRAEVDAIARAASAAGVAIIAGDTKVVERGHADAMYICTTGIGETDPRAELSPASLRPGDQVLVSGSIGEHGTAIMLARDEFALDAAIESDTRPLWPTVDALLDAAGPSLRCLRDATRGGVASVLNELARASAVSVCVREADVPVRPQVAGAAELLGIDPMYVANEGRLIAVVAPEQAERALTALRSIPGGETAAAIGEVGGEPPGMVLVQTAFGGRRVMDLLVGDPLPRIC